jgi:hypothetical protein
VRDPLNALLGSGSTSNQASPCLSLTTHPARSLARELVCNRTKDNGEAEMLHLLLYVLDKTPDAMLSAKMLKGFNTPR